MIDPSRLTIRMLYALTSGMLKTFKFRLYPTKQQQPLLEQRNESVRRYEQQATLPALKSTRPTLAAVQSQVLQNVAARIDLAYQAFFRRVRSGEKAGYPRFRGKGRYNSITFPQVPIGCKLDAQDKRLRVMNVGLVKCILHRPLDGTPKTATISRSSTDKWYVCFVCNCAEPSPLPMTGQQVGIDVGLKTFATISTGQEITNPRFFRAEEQALAKAQRRLSTVEDRAPERAARRTIFVRVHERTRWQRSDFTHQYSRRKTR
jgi:putative transposase